MQNSDIGLTRGSLNGKVLGISAVSSMAGKLCLGPLGLCWDRIRRAKDNVYKLSNAIYIQKTIGEEAV
jgi:hypothetical protein